MIKLMAVGVLAAMLLLASGAAVTVTPFFLASPLSLITSVALVSATFDVKLADCTIVVGAALFCGIAADVMCVPGAQVRCGAGAAGLAAGAAGAPAGCATLIVKSRSLPS